MPDSEISPAAAIDDTVRAAISRDAVVAMSIGGGKASTAAAFSANRFLDAAGGPRRRRIVVHADLGRAEWQQTPGTVEAVASALQPMRWLPDIGAYLLSATLSSTINRVKRFARGRRVTEALLPAGLRYVKGWPLWLPTLVAALQRCGLASRPLSFAHGWVMVDCSPSAFGRRALKADLR